MTIWRMGIACWIPKATNTHSDYVTLNVFLQNTGWLPKVYYNTYPEKNLVFIKIKKENRKHQNTPTASVATTVHVTHIVCLWTDRHFKKYGRWLKFRFILQSLQHSCLCACTHKARLFCTTAVSSRMLSSIYVFKPCDCTGVSKSAVLHANT